MKPMVFSEFIDSFGRLAAFFENTGAGFDLKVTIVARDLRRQLFLEV